MTGDMRPSAPPRLAAACLAALMLAGCGAGDPSGLTTSYAPSAPVPSVPLAASAGEMVSQGASRGPGQAAITVAFLPVVGIPADKAPLLSKALGETAAARGLAVAPAGTAAPYRLKGHFSAVPDGTGVRLVHVFDVYDSGEQLIERIQGSESLAGSAGDPWAGVDEAAFRRIAERMVESLARSADARA